MFGRHTNVALQFSGGKDSIACLMLLRDRLDSITVVWADSGDAFPETLAQMELVKAMCPNFVCARGEQPECIERNGFPVDILPIENHPQIQHLAQQRKLKLQGFMECCYRNILKPLHDKTLELGATLIIRGQKNCDRLKSPVRSGDVVDGIEYLFPLEDWSDARVLAFVQDSGLLPEHYQQANTSLDCMTCTAHLRDNGWKLPYLDAHHPSQAATVRHRLKLISQELEPTLHALSAAQGLPARS
jgi:phosphoadenosine phosphosulfate reductase